jgi:threonine aldolase
MKSFASDNYSEVLPEIMEALNSANVEHTATHMVPNPVTSRTISLFREVFQADVDVHFVFNGTGANILSISSATHSYNAVLCADTSHIYNDESSAPETFTGCRFFPLKANNNGKLILRRLKKDSSGKGDVHYPQTAMLSITQATEYGTVYTPQEIRVIADVAHEHGLYLHMDGSRFSMQLLH